MPDKLRAILIVVCILAFVVIGHVSVWGMPYTPAMVVHVPWYGWLLLVVGIVLIYTKKE